MRILLVNDDGIQAEGIQALVKVLSLKHDIIVAAPAREQSGMAHAITVRKRIEVARYTELENLYHAEAWKIDGTPADCVKLYLEAIAGNQKPDLIISGINHGANLGTDVLYSGTVGAAIEGYLHHISSIAVSLDIDAAITYEQTAKWFETQLERLLDEQLPVLFNINFPKSLQHDLPVFVYTCLGNRDYLNAFQRTVDENGRVFYCMAGEIYDVDNGDATDIYAVNQGLISVTPLQTNLTNLVSLDHYLKKDA